MKIILPQNIKKLCLGFLMITVFSLTSNATSLSVGDLAITSFNADGNDDFSFVLLTDISGTTTVYFTDCGWNSNTNNWGNTTEGTLTWTYTGSQSCGTEIQINQNAVTSSIGSVSESGNFSFSGTGDVIIAYTGTGIPNDGTEVGNFIWAVNGGSAGWTPSATTSTTSAIPNGLSDGVNCLDFGSSDDNYRYKCSGLLSPTDSLRKRLANDDTSYWDIGFSSENYLAPGCAYACSAVSPVGVTISKTDITCFGSNNGSATANATNGTTPFTYLWSNGASSQMISSLSAGTYTTTVTDNGGITATASIVITTPTSATWSTSANSNVSCNGGSDGSATMSVAGATTPYTFLWSNGETTATATGLSAGTNTVTLTDANGCGPFIDNVTISQPTSMFATNTGTTSVSCNGGSNGAATAGASNGTSPYTYLWSNASTSSNNTGLAAGTYTVTVTDNNGCTLSYSQVVSEPSALGTSITNQTNVSTNGGSDGSLTAAGSGGTAPYTYAWSNGATNATISSLSAGTYTISITDANGCGPATTTGTITQPSAISVSVVIDSNVTCNGFSDGGATASGTGGTMPYTYLWSNSSTNASITGVVAGTYTVTLTDNGGTTATASGIINHPSLLRDTTKTSTNVSCNGGSNGTANVIAIGGTSPYTYAWSNGDTTSSIANLSAGTYTVTFSDANACTSSESVVISEPSAMSATNTGTTSVSCNGGSNGSATAGAINGISPYTYLWSNASTSSNNTGLAAGTYTVTVTDNNGCTLSYSQVVSEPSAIGASITNQTNVSSSGGSDGSLTAAGSGGTVSYTYSWSNGATTATTSNLSAGTYTISITDANGCGPATTSATITQPSTITTSISSTTNVSCFGLSDGSLTGVATTGSAPYTYLWSNGDTVATISNLAAATYTVTITDGVGATGSSSGTVSQPSAIASSVVVDSNVSVNGFSDGGATASATGGTSPFTYSWSNAATTASITGVAAGTYTVSVTDANGCGPSSSSVAITEPSAVVASIVINNNVSCNGGSDGSATASGSGGVSPYTYLWSNAATTPSIIGVTAGTYTVTVTDNNGGTASVSGTITQATSLVASAVVDSNVSVNGLSDGGATASAAGGTSPFTYLWSNGASTASITGVVAGTYSVTVADNNGCTDNTSANITEPSSLVINAVVDSNISCNGLSDGGASVSVSGGTVPYTYIWSNAATTASITGVVAGTYSVTVSDNNGGTGINSVSITEPNVLVAAASVDSNVSCANGMNGAASATAFGGTAPYTYIWSNGGTSASVGGLSAGTYTVTVTDANGCSDTDNRLITQPAILTGSMSVTACDSYTWMSNGMNYTTSGTYIDTVQNAAGCDSIVTLSLSINNSSSSSATILVCDAGFYFWGGDTLRSSGTYLDTIANGVGCDSLMTLNLALSNTAITQLTDTVCDWTISAGGDTLTMTGLYSDTLSTMAGCDSIITLNLLVNNSSDTLFTASACDSYIWAITGDTLTASGNYSDTISNAAGCDSVIWLDLTIINPSLTVVNDTACDVYVWTNTGDTLMSTGSYYDTLSNVAGCDSIIQLDLLINNSSNDTTVAAACDSYTWAENGQTYTQSGLYLETRTNAAGCDSILSLDLIITNIDSTVVNTGDSVFAFSSGLAYQWLNCDSTALAVPGMIAGATNRGYRPDTTGNFAVIIYNGSCVDTSSCTMVTYIGLGETKGAASSFSIYPNPTKNNFKVAFDQTIANGPLQVFNMEGKLVYEVQQVRSGQSIEIDGLSEGLYTVRFNNQFKKLIVTN